MENEEGERGKAEANSPAATRADDEGSGEALGAAVPPERHVMRWESFLPRRSLRVLLVESDDSTRHIVAALLRKCNYRVAGVADGMKAWEVMKEKRYCFDLVLTEVAMPSLSGIGLLTKIMAAEECKNIPVIMMSTHDSVNVVLKCMLKGAVDFLVKPVRKNELRNLWQHVWRRHRSNRDMIRSDNNTASNQISANVGTNVGGRSEFGENSDEKSDAQSSGSKSEIEIESIQKREEPPQIEITHTADREANLDASDKDATIRATGSKIEDGDNARNYKPVGVRVDVALPIQETSVANASQEQNGLFGSSHNREENLALLPPAEGNKDDPESCCQNNSSKESVQNMLVFVEPMSNGQCGYAVLKKDVLMEGGLCETAKSPHVNKGSNVGTSPQWEPSLRRPEFSIQPEIKEKHVLKHSVASAFSRYGEKRTGKSVSSGLCVRTRACVEKCHPLGSGRGADDEQNTPFSRTGERLVSPQGNKVETTVYFQVSSGRKENAGLPSECAGHSSVMEDNVLPRSQFSFIPLPIPVGPIPYQSLCAGLPSFLQPVLYPETSLALQNSAAFDKSAPQIPSTDHSVRPTSKLIKHSSSSEFRHLEEIDHPSLWRRAIDISEAGGKRELSTHMEPAYQSGSCRQDVLKGIGSNGSGEIADGIESTGAALENGNESGVRNCDKKVLDCDHSRREAALIKFRMKRKDRCFEKKVRYYSRQKLAEQRPRVKGQFVRQKFPESTTPSEGDN